MPHNPLGPVCTAATVHLAAAVPNFSWLETRVSPNDLCAGGVTDDVFPVQPRLEGAAYPAPEPLGLGIEVNEVLLERDSFQFWEAPTSAAATDR